MEEVVDSGVRIGVGRFDKIVDQKDQTIVEDEECREYLSVSIVCRNVEGSCLVCVAEFRFRVTVNLKAKTMVSRMESKYREEIC